MGELVSPNTIKNPVIPAIGVNLSLAYPKHVKNMKHLRISTQNLPLRMPKFSIFITWYLYDRFHIPEWALTLLVLGVVLNIIIWLYVWYKAKFVNVQGMLETWDLSNELAKKAIKNSEKPWAK